MPLGRGADVPAGTLTGECWLVVQADRAATQAIAAAAAAFTARIPIRRTTARPGCAGVMRYRAVSCSGGHRSLRLSGTRCSHLSSVKWPTARSEFIPDMPQAHAGAGGQPRALTHVQERLYR